MIDSEIWIGTDEAAVHADVCRKTVLRLFREGRIQARKVTPSSPRSPWKTKRTYIDRWLTNK